MPATDDMAARLQERIDRANAFIEEIASKARAADRDLSESERSLIAPATKELEDLNQQQREMADTMRILRESRANTAALAAETARDRRFGDDHPAAKVEYRSVGEYIADRYYAQLGDKEAHHRQEIYHRVAAHQTTADNPGLIPVQIVQPVVNFIEVARPLVNTLGPTDLGSGAWEYARVTQHTQVGKQNGEKTELPSRKMTVTKTPLGADTFGGYVNLAKQNINRTSPAILDMVITDLAQQYAIETEDETGTVLVAAATAGPTIPAAPTALDIAKAIWGAAGLVFAATKGQGRTIVAVAPDMLGVVGPLFPPINPTNAFSSGFPAFSAPQGDQGSISGLTVIMSAGLNPGTILVYSTAAAKTFEYVYGNLQVNEPSVWGVQVGYAGDFDAVVIEPAGIVKVAITP